MHICPKILFEFFGFSFGHLMTRSLCCRSFLGSLSLTIFNFEEGERFYFLAECLLFFHYFYTIFHYLGFFAHLFAFIFFTFLSSFFRVGFSSPSLCPAQFHQIPFNSASHFASHSTPHPSSNRCLRFSHIVFSI